MQMKEAAMPTRLLSLQSALLHPSGLGRLRSRLLAASGLARSRHSLRLLDDHLLCDIGLTRAEALAEADRASWDAPAHWRG